MRTFPRAGVYAFDTLSVCCQRMTSYQDEIAALRTPDDTAVTFGTDRIDTTISVDEPVILTFSLPYSEGWSAQVDGADAPLLRTNILHTSVYLGEGTHTVTLRYRTPYLRAGARISLAGWVIFLILSVSWYDKKKNLHKK